MKETQSVKTEGAELVFDVRGAGEPLILIPGAGGDASVYDALASNLSGWFTVITYDRRCNARSSGDVTADLDMAQQARDIVAILQAAGHAQAIVFGNSGGANIALQLAADHPARVRALILHEPPTVSLLRDGETLDFVNEVYRISQDDGAMAAMKRFAGRLAGFDKPRGRPEGLGRSDDLPFFFGREYLNITLLRPDFGAIRDADIRTVVLAGEKSEDAYYVQTARLVAEKLGAPFVTVPGNHLAFMIEPAPFSKALGTILAETQSAYS